MTFGIVGIFLQTLAVHFFGLLGLAEPIETLPDIEEQSGIVRLQHQRGLKYLLGVIVVALLIQMDPAGVEIVDALFLVGAQAETHSASTATKPTRPMSYLPAALIDAHAFGGKVTAHDKMTRWRRV